MTQPPKTLAALTVLAAAALTVRCCAGPVLIASGAVAGLGAALRNPWLTRAGTAILLAAVVYTATRVARRHRSEPADAHAP